MRIAAIRHAVPSQRITTDWLVTRFRERNAEHLSNAELDAAERRLRRALHVTGTEVRYRLDVNERAIDFARMAGSEALAQAECRAEDVDLIIYAGVARGWLEPATASVLQTTLGCVNATAFDVLDACAGWLRALQVVSAYLDTGMAKRALIVTCECGFGRYGAFDLERPEDIDRYVAMCTIGEAATATVVTNDRTEEGFACRLQTLGRHFDLCMLPLENAGSFIPGTPRTDLVPLQLYADARPLLEATIRAIVTLYRESPEFRDYVPDIGFGHAASEKAAELVIAQLGLPRVRYVGTHAQYGNTVSSSIPLAMSLARERGLLRRGQQVLAIVGASGITVGLARFRY